ncbi:MAG: TatD family hydrolase, partial [Bacteroidaceae bacterium]|nr:TatD family hydrolase [Bacteroidaceae bacterium]
MFIDTHAHIYEDDFRDDLDQVIARAKEAGAQKVLLPPTDEASTLKALELSRHYPDFCHPMIGLHPEDIGSNYPQALQ